jgi:hypothetical protein
MNSRKDAQKRGREGEGVTRGRGELTTHDSRLTTHDSALNRAEFFRRGAAAFAGSVLALPVLNGCARTDTPPATDEMDELRKVDQRLIRYHEVGRIETGFQEARGVAVGPDGALYAAGDQKVAVFGADGARRAEIPTGGPPECLAVGPDGALYAGLPDRVEVYDASGRQKAAWEPFGPRAVLTSLAVGKSGVWAADAGNRVVYRCDETGKVFLRIGEKDAAKGYPGLIVPSPHLDVAVGRDGMVYVGNPGMHRIEAWTPDGRLKSMWGKEGSDIETFCGCCNPTDFTITPDGLFVTSEKGLPRIKVYSVKGKFECVVAPPDAFAHDTFGIDLAVDAQGHIVALDPKAKAVRVFVRV